MQRLRHPFTALTAVLAVAIAACGGDVSPAGGLADPGAAAEPLELDASGVPVTIAYSINGNPVVGRPVGVEIRVSTPLDGRPIVLDYRAPEAGSLAFPESQAAQLEILPVAGTEPRPRQITVIPQRDGRLFLTVVASIETDRGAVRKSIAVPLQVAAAPPGDAAEGEADAAPDAGVR